MHTPKVDDLPSRLKLIYAGVTEILPSSSLIISPLNKSLWRRTLLSPETGAGTRRGDCGGGESELPVFEYAARQVKQTVVGIGVLKKARCSIWSAPC